MSYKLTILLAALVCASFFDTYAMNTSREEPERPPSPYLAQVAPDVEPYLAQVAPAQPQTNRASFLLRSIPQPVIIRYYDHYHVLVAGQEKTILFHQDIAGPRLYNAATIFKNFEANEYYMLEITQHDQPNRLVRITYDPALHTDIICFDCFDGNSCVIDPTSGVHIASTQPLPEPGQCCTLL